MKKAAFSLVEIVLALGIIGIALLAIFGLFGTALRSNSETLSQQEVLGLSRSFTDFLRSTNSGAGFTNVYDWVRNPSNAPELYSFALSNGVFTNGVFGTSLSSTSIEGRPGRLYRMVIGLSPNLPIRPAGTNIQRPVPSDLPANPGSYTNDAALGVQVRAFMVGATGVPLSSLQPVFTYDTTVFR
ncbi:MAG: hypothetical protein SFU53_15565 [Terrimicrobiaceae bacterium]|nr:hypothetical protein [Terrimicrobiaceae bacterium]